MKKLFLLAAALAVSVYGQGGPPDCVAAFTVNNSAVNSVAVKNQGCIFWNVAYTSYGFTGLSLTLQQAPDTGNGPGSWKTFAGTGELGSNPSTSITGAYYTILASDTDLAAFVRVNLTSSVGTGAASGFVYGYKTFALAAGGGGGGGGGPTTNQNIRAVSFLFDGAGSALSGTLSRCQQINYSGTIQEVTLVADQSGAATVDVRTVAYSSYTGPSSASTITASDTPALSSAVKYQDSTLTGWTTSLSANTVVCFVLSSPSTVTWVAGNIKIAAN